jgi:RNA-directed DNA polymerase
MENINSWKDIPWLATEERVFRLQLRIYRAAADQELEKMYKLQKLLISSSSAKFLSVRKVTQINSGKNIPGVDNVIIDTPKGKFALAKRLKLDGKSFEIRRTYLEYPDGKRHPFGIPTIEDRAKQMLAYLALCPQWEAWFEASSYGFRPGKSVLDAMEALFLGIFKKPKWVLDAEIAKCFDQINHSYLLQKCQTFPNLQKQIRAWLKAGILDGQEYAFPEMGTPQGGIISPLLANIALHGLGEEFDQYINSLGGNRRYNRQAFTYVRYADDFVLMHPEKEVLEGLILVIRKFLEPIGLELHPEKTQFIHTLESYNGNPPGFTFLGFDIIQKKKRNRQRKVFTKPPSKQTFVTLITPSKKGAKEHKEKLREVIRSYRGATQERLIQKLNPIIRGWTLSKRTYVSSKTFQALDQYVFVHLWKWVLKRHPKMSKTKLKELYWHQVGSRNWVFGVKTNEEVKLQLQMHSKVSIQRFAKVKGNASPFDGNLIYWAK